MKILLISGHGAGDPGAVSQFGKEADETIYMVEEIKKTLSAYAQVDLYPTERNAYKDWINLQIKADLEGVTADQVKTMVIAYEPIWAIGTGKTATTEQAQEVCGKIRECIAEVYDDATAAEIRIQYGGSVNSKTAADLFAQADIDGGLVGGASLKEEFGQIVNYK